MTGEDTGILELICHKEGGNANGFWISCDYKPNRTHGQIESGGKRAVQDGSQVNRVEDGSKSLRIHVKERFGGAKQTYLDMTPELRGIVHARDITWNASMFMWY